MYTYMYTHNGVLKEIIYRQLILGAIDLQMALLFKNKY